MPLFDKLYLNIGAMKAGTTWLYRQLEQHPDVLFSPEKELHYHAFRSGDRASCGLRYRLTRARNALDRAPGGWTSPATRRALGWYLPYVALPPVSARWYRRRFPARVPAGAYCADFSNLTAVIDSRGWVAIREMAATVRLSYVLRHPLERAWSHLKFLRQLGTTQAEPEALAARDIERLDSRYHLWRHSHYSLTIDRLRQHFDSHEVKLLFYDDIAARPAGVLCELEDFLGLARHDYAEHKLVRRINVSAPLSVPDVVRAAFADRLERELSELQARGIDLPHGWRQG